MFEWRLRVSVDRRRRARSGTVAGGLSLGADFQRRKPHGEVPAPFGRWRNSGLPTFCSDRFVPRDPAPFMSVQGRTVGDRTQEGYDELESLVPQPFAVDDLD